MTLGLLVASENANKQTDRQTRFMFYKYRFCISLYVPNYPPHPLVDTHAHKAADIDTYTVDSLVTVVQLLADDHE